MRTRGNRPIAPSPDARRLLAPHINGALVIAEAEIHRMPQLPVAGPRGELDLRDELGPRPVRPLFRLRLRGERTLFRFERLEELHHARELLLVEAGARVTRVDERAVLVHAEQQRAEVRARVPRLGPAADDEFLLVDDL